MLKINKNMLISFVTCQNANALFDKCLCVFNTINAVKNKSKFTNGPANAINEIASGDCTHPAVSQDILTNAGTKNITGDLANAKINPNPSHTYAAWNIAE